MSSFEAWFENSGEISLSHRCQSLKSLEFMFWQVHDINSSNTYTLYNITFYNLVYILREKSKAFNVSTGSKGSSFRQIVFPVDIKS